MKKLRNLHLLPFLVMGLLLLFSCEEDHFQNNEISRLDKVAPHNSSKRLEQDTVDSIQPQAQTKDTLHAVNRKKNAKKQATQLDTAIEVIDYRDSIAGGKEVSDSSRKVDIIIIHSSYNTGVDTFSAKGIIGLYEKYGVSAHYLLGRDGEIFRLVDENDLSYHAGESKLPANPKRTHLNDNSIGIEVMSTERIAPTPQQYEQLIRLVNNIRARHNIKYIYRHSDIAPGRKTDPWSFDWDTFLTKLKFHNPDPVTGNIDVNEEINEIINKKK